MRKYILSTSILSAVFGGWSVLQQTRRGPVDWRVILLWVSWGITVALAIGTVSANSKRQLDD